MTALYGYKWTSANGEEFEERTHVGRVWIDKTKDLTDEDWFRAVDRCEKEVRDRTKTGDESWPPSYEVFVTYAKESRKSKYWNGAPGEFVHRLPEPKEAKEERKTRGRERIGTIRSIFDE